MADVAETIKLYYDFKSPFTYLAMDPAYKLEETHRVQLRFIPLEARDTRSLWRRPRAARAARLGQSALPLYGYAPVRQRARDDHPRAAKDF